MYTSDLSKKIPQNKTCVSDVFAIENESDTIIITQKSLLPKIHGGNCSKKTNQQQQKCNNWNRRRKSEERQQKINEQSFFAHRFSFGTKNKSKQQKMIKKPNEAKVNPNRKDWVNCQPSKHAM